MRDLISYTNSVWSEIAALLQFISFLGSFLSRGPAHSTANSPTSSPNGWIAFLLSPMSMFCLLYKSLISDWFWPRDVGLSLSSSYLLLVDFSPSSLNMSPPLFSHVESPTSIIFCLILSPFVFVGVYLHIFSFSFVLQKAPWHILYFFHLI